MPYHGDDYRGKLADAREHDEEAAAARRAGYQDIAWGHEAEARRLRSEADELPFHKRGGY